MVVAVVVVVVCVCVGDFFGVGGWVGGVGGGSIAKWLMDRWSAFLFCFVFLFKLKLSGKLQAY